MAIDKQGWTTDEKNTASKQDKFIHGGDLNKQHAAYQAEQEKKAGLSKGQMVRNRIPKEKDFKGTW
jgi:hypothetical protein